MYSKAVLPAGHQAELGESSEPKKLSSSHRDHRAHRESNGFTRFLDSPRR